MGASFYSTYTNKIDRKGRVSVPHAFRTQLEDQELTGIIAFPAMDREALCCAGLEMKDAWQRAIELLPPLSDDRLALEAILSQMQVLPFDGEGRVTLPETLSAAGYLTETIAFAGAGSCFYMWEPSRYAAYVEAARNAIRARKITLPTLAAAS